MPTLSLQGRPSFYEDRGEGVPLLLFHGFPFSSQSFWPQLAAPPKGVRLLAPDHRGFGQSAPGPGVSTMEAMAEDGLALLDALGIQSALVGGVSMGGYVAIALTRLDPGRVQGLVLIDTQSTADDEAGRARRETTALDVEKNGVAGLVSGMLPKLMAAGVAPETKARVEKLMLAQSAQAVAAASRGMASRIDGKDILSRFSGPCSIIVGAEDQITPVEKAKLMQSLVGGSTLEVIEGAGHLSNLERPGEFQAIIERFVNLTAGR
ncbi:MAG: alpha/beta hydrolase [Archangium sp.]|nr:alpha/beta hydrolase [Archangium sp.]MDP3152441.1 alpha/beta hydrolase [Archangium sp.]MDP3572389.1 alpha/beta hydrolase [Archangium sp.]